MPSCTLELWGLYQFQAFFWSLNYKKMQHKPNKVEKNSQLQVPTTNNLVLIYSEVQLLENQGAHFFLFVFFNLPIMGCDSWQIVEPIDLLGARALCMCKLHCVVFVCMFLQSSSLIYFKKKLFGLLIFWYFWYFELTSFIFHHPWLV